VELLALSAALDSTTTGAQSQRVSFAILTFDLHVKVHFTTTAPLVVI
jgi:hypothetical protein